MQQAKTYRMIDAHTHIFPLKIAAKAADSIGNFYNIQMSHEGSVERLLESGSKIGVEKYLVCSTATRPEQVRSINDFVAAEVAAHPNFFGFGTLHPHFEDNLSEIERILSLGLKGIKFHPDFQTFDIDDPSMMKVYEALEGRLPILFHMGDDRYDYSAPGRLAKIAKRFPNLQLQAAHFGGYRRWQDAGECKDCPNIFFDTSSSLFVLQPEEAAKMIREFGHERFLFATDFPMWDHSEELARFMAIPLTEKEREDIFANNFDRIYLNR